MPVLYIISGCNGAGKTTASKTILPAVLDCVEFVNADEIARGLSPFNPEGVSFKAGRLMLERIYDLLEQNTDFAIETTLATRSYHQLVIKAQTKGYTVVLIYLWLDSVELATERVKKRVEQGGHDIPKDVIKRRYYAGLRNLKQLFIGSVNEWFIYNNIMSVPELVAQGFRDEGPEVINQYIWDRMQEI